MYYIEDRGIIIAQQEEIFDNIKYKHIQKLIDDHPAANVQFRDDNILIFKVLKKYEGKNKIHKYGDAIYIELLCLCSLDIICEDDIGCIVPSKLTHYEQLQRIRSKYLKRGFNIPKITSFPKHMDEYGDKTYTIVPLLFDHFLGFISDLTDEKEEAELEVEDEGFDENLEYLD